MTQLRQLAPPDWRRITKAVVPALIAPVPALNVLVENANVVQNKQVATLNRAGSGPGNPILAGLGVRIQIGVGMGDILRGLYLYQERKALGNNLARNASIAGQYATFDFMAGSGQSVAGTRSTGAVKNLLRVVTDAQAFDKELWIQGPDVDIVTANGQACLNADFTPISIPLSIVDVSRPWIDVNVDFMPSWNDEFQVLARGDGSQQAEAGF